MSNYGEYKNIVITGVSPTQGGHFNTMPFDEKVASNLEMIAAEIRNELKAGRKPGKFLIRKRKEEGIANSRSKQPYFLEFVPASEVQAFEANRPKQNQGL